MLSAPEIQAAPSQPEWPAAIPKDSCWGEITDGNGRFLRRFYYPNDRLVEHVGKKTLCGEEWPLPPFFGERPLRMFDVGACVGTTSIYFSVGLPGIHIRCYEPNKRLLPYLIENTRDLGKDVGGSCTVAPAGLLARSAVKPLYEGKYGDPECSIYPSSQNTQESHQATFLSVSGEIWHCDWDWISILKIDTEGCEVEILREFLQQTHVETVLVEYHSDRDRRALDALLDQFDLWYSKADRPHRGTLCYTRRNLIARQWRDLEIKSGGTQARSDSPCRS